MSKILIVEDELPIADLIRLTLKSAGYLCDHAPDGDQAADLAAAGNYDLALVDVMLPRTDGFTLLEYFQSLELPVIFVTARSAVADRVKGLKLGAEDYIVKPFEMKEVLARIHAVLRRTAGGEEEGGAKKLAFDKLVINLDSYELLVDGQTLAARKAAWTAPRRELSGYARRYAQHVTSGSTGAVFDDMLE